MGNKKSKIIKSDATVIEKYDESSSKEHMAILDTDLQTSVSIFIVALGTIISVPSALSGAAVIVFGTVLPMFWSEPNSDVWDNVSSKVSDLISEAIKDVVFQTAVAHLRGLNNLGVDFSKDYETWLNNGNGLDSLSRSYDHLEKTYRDRMPSFAIKGQEHVLLPLYAQAAFSHIKLMRTGYDNYEKWNLNSKTNYISKPDILSKIIE
ncbi:insecticidal delta-endotoxin Cry8Ea1 family protein, partial [Yersinia sp. 1252 StPb PI]|uniref:insecticidal delta-endotoxin Cry8Ea1 family protein n=1 Tax=Yersinia sp. 1252 StPb PI TaxID=3117404 RepID=UPI003B28954F